MADLRAALERVAELETLAVVLDSQNHAQAATIRAQAAEIRALRVLVDVADRFAAEGRRLRELHGHRATAGASPGLRQLLWWRAGCRLDLGHQLARARHWAAGQGPGGPRAAYRLDPHTLRRGPAVSPLATETGGT